MAKSNAVFLVVDINFEDEAILFEWNFKGNVNEQTLFGVLQCLVE